MKIFHKLILSFIAVSLLIWVAGYFAITFSKKALNQSFINHIGLLVDEMMNEIDARVYAKFEVFQEYSRDLILLETITRSNHDFSRLDNISKYITKKDDEWRSLPKDEITPFMESLINNRLSTELRQKISYYEEKHGHRVFAEVFVTNKYGANIAQTGKTSDYRQDDEEWWQSAKRDGVYVGNISYDESAEVYSNDIGIRVDDKNGNFIGIIKVVLSIDEIIDIIDRIHLRGIDPGHEHSKIMLVDSKGRLLYSTSKEDIFLSDVSYMFEPGHCDDDQTGFSERYEEGGSVLYLHSHSKGYNDFKGMEMSLLIGHEKEELLSPVVQLGNRIIIVSLIVTIIAVIISFLISSNIVNRLRMLADASVKIGRGELDMPIDARSNDEIGQLADAFNKMNEQLRTTTVKRNELELEIVERKKMQDQVVQAKEEWENTFNTINDAITVHDNDFNITRANKAAEELLGLPLLNITKQKCYESYHGTDCPPEGCPSCQTLKTGIPSVTELFEPKLKKHLLIKAIPRFDKNKQLIGLVHVVTDITERKKAENEQQSLKEQLFQAQRMESIGTLVGGIAHDFNNILNAISGFGTIIDMGMKEDDPLRPHLKEIFDAVERATNLINNLLAFSRKQVLETKAVNLNDIINNTSKMLLRIIREDIELKTKLSDEDLIVMADNVQINQVLMNLSANARDAMPDGGLLTINTESFEIDEEYIKAHGYGLPGRYALMTVSDTGTGMDEQTKNKIFEPFFTTKEFGKGTGLGLAITYGIIKQHNGFINIYSETGQGTTFKIYLPLTTTASEEIKAGAKDPMKGGSETILVAEDDDASRKMTKSILEQVGYKVILAENGDDAVSNFLENQHEIALIISDVMMPKKNGREAYDEIKKIRSDIKAIL